MKFSKTTAYLLSVIILLSSLFTVGVFATDEGLGDDEPTEIVAPTEAEEHTDSISIEITPVEPETQKPTEAPVHTEAPESTKPRTTSAPVQPKPTQQPVTRPQQKPPKTDDNTPVDRPANNQPGNNAWQPNTPVDNQTSSAAVSTTAAQAVTQSPTMADGSFYAYIELNNGISRMKHRLQKPDVLPEPDEPTRKGFVFAGWYSDPEFKKKWDFDKDIAMPGCILYAKWVDDGTDKTIYTISVAPVSGGKIEVNPQKAQQGETVNISVTPDTGMRIKPGSLTVNGKSTEFFSFEMISGNVTIAAEFEKVAVISNEKNVNIGLIIAAAAVFAAVVIFAAVMVIRKRRSAQDDADEADDGNWIDSSLVVKNGFKDGDKVAKNDDETDIDSELVSLDDIFSEDQAEDTDSKE